MGCVFGSNNDETDSDQFNLEEIDISHFHIKKYIGLGGFGVVRMVQKVPKKPTTHL